MAEQTGLADLTWTCHVCGRVRPDRLIAVHSRLVVLDGIEVQENVRYCADSRYCADAAAAGKTWAQPKPVKPVTTKTVSV